MEKRAVTAAVSLPADLLEAVRIDARNLGLGLSAYAQELFEASTTNQLAEYGSGKSKRLAERMREMQAAQGMEFAPAAPETVLEQGGLAVETRE